ncbi:JmjC domain, hydroxylase-domain-containing protein [Lipomyces arxii]|uniref:JmjC domain, hydroxylase-domain-containing protein n=1 Tax=Lipomyces arxii TaxID=56418 RepID=UPI0034CE7FE7
MMIPELTTSSRSSTMASSISPPVSTPTRMRSKQNTPITPIPLTNHGISSVTTRHRLPAMPLDFATVETVVNKADKQLPRPERPFGLQEAPTYYPTEDQFKDPFNYINTIANEGKEYGIIKIIPPDSWRPSFALDSQRFWFKTRRQELNSMEGGTRANLNFLDQLHKFHKQRGLTFNKLPSVDRRPLDLYRLKKGVDLRGGFDIVCKKKLWAEIGRELGYSGKIMTSLSSSLKGAYQKYIAPYEKYLIGAKPLVQKQLEAENGPSPVKRSRTISSGSADSTSSPLEDSKVSQSPVPSVSRDPSEPSLSLEPSEQSLLSREPSQMSHDPSQTSHDPSLETRRLSREQSRETRESVSRTSADPQDTQEAVEPQRKRLRSHDEPPATVVGSNMTVHRPNGAVKRLSIEHVKIGENCEVCGRGDNASSMLLCDGCDTGYHMACLTPPLRSVPDYDWYCDKCLVGTGEFGFEDGQVYNLRQFQDKAKKFEDHYWAGKLPQDSKTGKTRSPTEDEVENEFWRLVEDVTDTVEVEYGADIHSTIHGSAFPTLERNPLDTYAADPWNLNVMPLLDKSLFKHIKSDVSGMTVPWLYVGMMFSTFCWHSEDHFTYSANYQHFGATKTWYGIPGADAEKFEDAMRKAVPELFEQQPDLLFQLVTMLSPKTLKEENVRCYALDQRPGEFVITFPQAYHAGFNHGFNFNEAVNFAPPDWEPFGKLGVEIYQDYRKLPVFSHDELLVTAALKDNSVETAAWLAPALQTMLEQELAMRAHVREIYPGLVETHVMTDCPDAEFQCAYCNTYSYLSQLTCGCTNAVACLNHGDELCECDRQNMTMRVRFTDQKLVAMVKTVRDRADGVVADEL